MSEEAKLKARQEFQRIDAALIGAMNGIGRPVGTQEELVELRRSLMQARHECEALGVNIETVWEQIQKQRIEEEKIVRRYAEDQINVIPMVPAVWRQRIAKAGGFAIAMVVLFQWATLSGVLCAVLAGVIIYTLIDSVVAEFLPTPAVRIARMASERDVDVSDLWPKESLAYNDYVYAYSRHQMRLEQRRPGGWIKAR
jgi:hypothetical protein